MKALLDSQIPFPLTTHFLPLSCPPFCDHHLFHCDPFSFLEKKNDTLF